MMHNTYTSSIISLRTSFCYNDYYYSNERCPSSCCSCCCSYPLNSSRLVVPINPSCLYGLRQSTLIHWPPSRRLILGSGDRYCYRSLVSDVGRRCCGETWCVKQDRVGRVLEKNCKEKSCVKEKNVNINKIRGRIGRRNYGCSALGDAEAMLSLLAEDSIEESLEVEIRRSSAKEGKVVKKQNVVSEKKYKGRKENVGHAHLESEMKKYQLDPSRVQSREEGHKRREEMEVFSKEEDRILGRRESSSSYYSLSEAGDDDFESNTEVEIKHEGFERDNSNSNQKGSRKIGGIVISEETKRDSKRHIDERVQQLHSSTHDDSRVGSSTEWDCRKKSEKKLAEESSEQTKSKKDSFHRQSQLHKTHESSSMKASSSKKQLNFEEKESTSGVSFHGQSMSHVKTDSRASDDLKSSNRHEQVTQTSINDAGTSSWRRSNKVEEGLMVVGKSVQETGCEHCKACGGIMQQKKTQTEFKQRAELSEIVDDASIRKQEKSSTSLQTSVNEGNKQSEQTSVNTGRTSHRYRKTVDTHDSYVESTSRSQRQSEARMKNLEENSTSVISGHGVKGLREESSGATKESESSKISQTGLDASQVHSTFEKRIPDVQTYSTSKVKCLEEVVEKHKQIEETNVQSTLRNEVQRPIQQLGFTGNSSGEATITQQSVNINSQTGVQQHSEGDSNLQSSVTLGGPSTIIGRNDSGKVAEVGTGSAYIHPQARFGSSSDEVNGSRSRLYDESSSKDALGSATRMEESSIQIVGEFVEKIRHEASTSDTRMEKKSTELDSINQDEKHVLKGSTQSDSKKTRLQKQGSRRSSGGSGAKGPSDKMWDVEDHFSQEPSEMESLEGATSENVIPRRTGKSLWNVVVGIFQLRWGSRSETQKSPVKGGPNSPNESAGGETWFSGNDQDEANSDNLKTEQANMLQESTSSSVRTSSLSGVTQQIPQSNPSLDLSVPSRRLRRSHAFEEIEEASQNEGVVSSTREQKEHTIDVKQTSISSSEIIDAELKQRKLQKSKQVLQERFEEWESAYRRENDQRKVDEIFMREALVEAKKAADSWEVPVGAVLVQNGNIIARGYNLVEELRDSTAHAEMICIREASNALKTWRLSETTLYVTLEPCLMCAGAILQARIGTLVWGAPNKLLGADGSWIRLFPEGAEGEERAEVRDKPAAPVHPFHPNMKIRRGVLEAECAEIMQHFFQLRRKKKLKKSEEEPQPSCLPVPHHPSKLLHKMHHVFHFFCL